MMRSEMVLPGTVLMLWRAEVGGVALLRAESTLESTAGLSSTETARVFYVGQHIIEGRCQAGIESRVLEEALAGGHVGRR